MPVSGRSFKGLQEIHRRKEGRGGGKGGKTYKNSIFQYSILRRWISKSACQSVLLQASEGSSTVPWVSLASGIELGHASLERSDVGHLRNNSSRGIFLSGKGGSFQKPQKRLGLGLRGRVLHLALTEKYRTNPQRNKRYVH